MSRFSFGLHGDDRAGEQPRHRAQCRGLVHCCLKLGRACRIPARGDLVLTESQRQRRCEAPKPARWPGLKGYVTNRADSIAEFVICSYQRLFQIEKSCHMPKHYLQTRPIYHHKRDSIEAHLTIVFAVAVAQGVAARERMNHPRPIMGIDRDPAGGELGGTNPGHAR
jgi:hypothetical protein